jgi:lipopolysaccharide export system protein LptA
MLLLGGAGAAQAQSSGCPGEAGHSLTLNGGTPAEQTFLSGGVTFTCPDGKLIKSDSAVVVRSADQTFLIGHAYYSDKEKTLTGDRIYYWGRDQHLTAQTGVVLTDKVNGAVFHGEFLDYYQPRPGQPESRGIIYGVGTGGRPHAVLRGKTAAAAAARPAPAPGQPAAPADTAATLVDADRMEIQGQKTFHAMGNVVLTRADMKGTAQEAFYSPDDERLKLDGNAKVTGQEVSLAGGIIDGTLAGNQFKDVTATFRAVLDAKDLHVKAPSLTVAFDSGQVRRLIALSAKRSNRTATDGDVLAEAQARDFRLTADSIDALAPNQKIERVVAVGRAYGESQNDSIKVKMPDIASKDWLRGDTITGFFADATPRAADRGRTAGNASPRNGRVADRGSARPAERAAAAAAPGGAPADTAQRVLERILAVGSTPPASSMYRIVDQKKPKAAPAISYLLAKRITVAFRDGEVSEVHAEGEIRGIHLEPQEKKPEKKASPPRRTVAQAPTPAGSKRP